MQPVTVRGLTIGEGLPKICVPLTASTLPGLIEEAKAAAARQGRGVDLVEWRVDSFSYRRPEMVREGFWNLRQTLGGIPILVTLRTKGEGGQADASGEGYVYRVGELLKLRPDLIDLELLTAGGSATRTVWEAHQIGVKVVVSSHDFEKTPSVAEMMGRFAQMNRMGADLMKVAVMPHTREDVLVLLSASVTAAAIYDPPLITVAMGKLGALTRLCGSFSGSAVTFGTVGASSAPGQMSAEMMARVLPYLQI